MASEKQLVIDTTAAEAMMDIFHGRGPIEVQYGDDRHTVFLKEGETPTIAAKRVKSMSDARDDIISQAPSTAELYGLTVGELATVLARVAEKLKDLEER